MDDLEFMQQEKRKSQQGELASRSLVRSSSLPNLDMGLHELPHQPVPTHNIARHIPCTIQQSIETRFRISLADVVIRLNSPEAVEQNVDLLYQQNSVFTSRSRISNEELCQVLEPIIRRKVQIVKHCVGMRQICNDSVNFPYGGFLTGRAPRVKIPGIADQTFAAKVRGMNCWGAIILAAVLAGLITIDNAGKLDSYIELPDGNSCPRLLRDAKLYDNPLEIPEGYIVGIGASRCDHVVLSLGSATDQRTRYQLRCLEVNARCRGETFLSELAGDRRQIFACPPPWLVYGDTFKIPSDLPVTIP